MTESHDTTQALRTCLDLVESGVPADEALKRFPDVRAEIEPLLRTAVALQHMDLPQAPVRVFDGIEAALGPRTAPAAGGSKSTEAATATGGDAVGDAPSVRLVERLSPSGIEARTLAAAAAVILALLLSVTVLALAGGRDSPADLVRLILPWFAEEGGDGLLRGPDSSLMPGTTGAVAGREHGPMPVARQGSAKLFVTPTPSHTSEGLVAATATGDVVDTALPGVVVVVVSPLPPTASEVPRPASDSRVSDSGRSDRDAEQSASRGSSHASASSVPPQATPGEPRTEPPTASPLSPTAAAATPTPLGAGVTISVMVADLDGVPLPDATVRGWEEVRGDEVSCRTGSGGACDLRFGAPGTFVVAAELENPFVRRWYDGKPSREEADRIVLESPGSHRDILIVLPAGAPPLPTATGSGVPTSTAPPMPTTTSLSAETGRLAGPPPTVSMEATATPVGPNWRRFEATPPMSTRVARVSTPKP
jgi:hypothetical protein